MTYYDRKISIHSDGTPVFETKEDSLLEAKTANILEALWNCSLAKLPRLSPIDWLAMRDERLMGFVELKCRSHPSSRYRTVFLNIRKWESLTSIAYAANVKAIFVVRFLDSIFWKHLNRFEAPGPVKMAGCTRIVKSSTDMEPVFDVKLKDMKCLKRFISQRDHEQTSS